MSKKHRSINLTLMSRAAIKMIGMASIKSWPNRFSGLAKNVKRTAPAKCAEAGFTLIEMLVVIAIIGLIMGLVGPRVLGYLADSKIKTARIQIQNLSAALDLYYLDSGKYPTSNEGLVALVQKPDGAANWNGPYLKGRAVPDDPWGQPYVYKVPGERSPYEVTSFGPNGRDGKSTISANLTATQ